MNAFARMTVAAKLAWGFGIILVLMVVSGAIAFFALSGVTERMNTINNELIPKVVGMGEVKYYQVDIARGLRNAVLQADTPEAMETAIKSVLESRGKIKAIIEKIEPTIRLPEGKALLKKILENRQAFIDGQESVIKLVRERKVEEAKTYTLTEMRTRQRAYAAAVDELVDFQQKLMDDSAAAAAKESSRAIMLIVIALLVSVVLAAATACRISRDLVAPLCAEPASATDNVRSIAAGDLSRRIETRHGDTSSLLVDLQRMQVGLSGLVGEIQGMVAAASRGDFSTRIPLDGKQGFGRDIGAALNQLADTTDTGLNDVMRVAQALAVGDLSQRIEKDYPGVFGATGNSMNATVAALKAIVADIERLVQAANQGNFATRVDMTGKQGFGRDLSQLLNQLSETTNTGLQDVMRVAKALAAGDLAQRIDKNYPGVFGETGQAVNATVDALKQIVADIDRIVQAANQGDFSIRTDLAGKQGFGMELSQLLNQLSATTESGLKDIMRVAGTLAQGDLTQTIEKDYPGLFGEARTGINTTVTNLTELISQIKESVELISTAANEIAAGNQDLSSRTEEQASSLEETASSMEQLTSTVKENTEGAKRANADAQAAADVAAKGGSTVKGTVSVMAEISESSKKIADIVGVIDSIAFQTNILALNAAVEAARAGEQGRGFAVVATEVRNLAKRSADAAREIKELIGDTVGRIDSGAAQANLAGKQMEDIVNAIANVSQVISDIAQAGIEQSTGIEQVTQAVSQMDEVTQQNAALVEEAAAAAESLREQSEQLSTAVNRFRLTGGSNGRALSAPAPQRRLSSPAPVSKPRTTAAKPLTRPAPVSAPSAAGSDEDWAEF